MNDIDNLLHQIEKLRSKMTTVALDKGLTSLESIAISQELDRLLNTYNGLKHKDLKERRAGKRNYRK